MQLICKEKKSFVVLIIYNSCKMADCYKIDESFISIENLYNSSDDDITKSLFDDKENEHPHERIIIYTYTVPQEEEIRL